MAAEECPAARPLCLCGRRGCPDAVVHAVALAEPVPRWQMPRKHQRKRRR